MSSLPRQRQWLLERTQAHGWVTALVGDTYWGERGGDLVVAFLHTFPGKGTGSMNLGAKRVSALLGALAGEGVLSREKISLTRDWSGDPSWFFVYHLPGLRPDAIDGG